MNTLKIAVVQCALIWENPEANRAAIENLLDGISADVVLLPEMFTTGFSMQAERIAERHDLAEMETLAWLRQQASRLDAALTGSVAVEDQGKFFNRMYWVTPDGAVKWYDKRQLFTFANEDKSYTPGADQRIVHWRGWNLMLQVCYDLRFPENARNGINDRAAAYDVLLYVANWPEVRRDPWTKLLYARAIENQCFVAACNRVGEDGNGIAYSGDSVILDARGQALASAPASEVCVLTATLDKDELREFRTKFPVLWDRRH